MVFEEIKEESKLPENHGLIRKQNKGEMDEANKVQTQSSKIQK